MNSQDYLHRIGVHQPVDATPCGLQLLHRQHMLTVPFENLDIACQQSMRCELSAFYDKVVRRHRGGFCYELNGLFAWLLQQLGFDTRLLSAQVYNSGHIGPEFDHLLLLVQLDQPYLVDVGFGDSFVDPLPLQAGEHSQHTGHFRLEHRGTRWLMSKKDDRLRWQPQFQFDLEARALADFASMFRYHCTSSKSVFTNKSVCTRATELGRVTISNGYFIQSEQRLKIKRRIPNQTTYQHLLSSHFAIRLDEHYPLQSLLAKPPELAALN